MRYVINRRAIAALAMLGSLLRTAEAQTVPQGLNVQFPSGSSAALVGSWRDLGAAANFLFKGDGTFEYAARFAPVDVSIFEKGKYTVNQDTLTVIPERKIYIQRGEKSQDSLVIRAYRWRVDHTPQLGRVLTLMIDGTVHRYRAEQ
jgi:hypothetical protein